MPRYHAVLTRSTHVKTVKTAFEEDGLLNIYCKIKRASTTQDKVSHESYEIVTNVGVRDGEDDLSEHDVAVERLERCLDRYGLTREQDFTLTEVDIDVAGITIAKNLLQAGVRKGLQESVSHEPWVHSFSMDDIVHELPGSYCLWGSMLLLPEHTFASNSWKQVLLYFEENFDMRMKFFSILAKAMHVTHIAINAPIPTLNPTSDGNLEADENLLRSPTNLQPLHGDFGPLLSPFPSHLPKTDDFSAAFWVSTRQNGINQVWAPRYTMFSAGNVTEKARLLSLPSVTEAVSHGKQTGQGCSAVDLFSGIGYFTFSYAKAGVSKVLCWDLNPWSIEGLRRGATLNKWRTYTVVDEGAASQQRFTDSTTGSFGESRFLLFCQSNVHAARHISELRGSLPPIRHVNCGMLPSVGEAWKTAVEALDPHLGGWLHLHETVAESRLVKRSEEIVEGVMDHVLHLEDIEGLSTTTSKEVKLVHIEKVKSVGPRMLHIVVDVWVPGRKR